MSFIIIFGSVLAYICSVTAQSSALLNTETSATPTSQAPTSASSAASTASSFWSGFESSTPLQPGQPSAGDPASSGNDGGSAAGASGSSSGSGSLSTGGLIAIVVIVSLVVVFGIVSSVLFFLAKKHDWQVKATIRKSAKRVATALTPRRSEFPRSVKDGRNSRGRTRLEEVPPTPRLKTFDIEKANAEVGSFEMKEPKPSSKWAQKLHR
ncbi:MAG: hypothetical protein M1818_003283 [Claussenomyces sp. TS43310]|nr:MAG: hypothetical protein M1818_003283 [Claussenomyces sp. TS43310]